MLKQLALCTLVINSFLLSMQPQKSRWQRPFAVTGKCDSALLEDRNDPSWTDLHQAAYRGKDMILLQHLIEQALLGPKGTVDLQDKFGQTPLWWAAHRGNLQAALLLLQNGGNVDHEDMFRRSVRSKIEANATLKPLLNPGIKP